MAVPHSLHEINMEVSKDAKHVYEAWRAMNEIVAKIDEVMQDPSMQEEISSHMQSLLYESTLMVKERGLERPLCRTPILTPMCQQEEDKRLVMMHAKVDDIQHYIQGDATQAKLSKEKARSHSCMSSDSVSRQ